MNSCLSSSCRLAHRTLWPASPAGATVISGFEQEWTLQAHTRPNAMPSNTGPCSRGHDPASWQGPNQPDSRITYTASPGHECRPEGRQQRPRRPQPWMSWRHCQLQGRHAVLAWPRKAPEAGMHTRRAKRMRAPGQRSSIKRDCAGTPGGSGVPECVQPHRMHREQSGIPAASPTWSALEAAMAFANWRSSSCLALAACRAHKGLGASVTSQAAHIEERRK